MRITKGNLLTLAAQGEFDVIIHGCNCFNKMGGGIAKQISTRWPEVLVSDAEYLKDVSEHFKLGGYSVTTVEEGFTIVNAYTQFLTSNDQRQTNYEAVARAFEQIKKEFTGKKIGIPMIGAGLGGGNWKIISTIIEEIMGDEDITVVDYWGKEADAFVKEYSIVVPVEGEIMFPERVVDKIQSLSDAKEANDNTTVIGHDKGGAYVTISPERNAMYYVFPGDWTSEAYFNKVTFTNANTRRRDNTFAKRKRKFEDIYQSNVWPQNAHNGTVKQATSSRPDPFPNGGYQVGY